MALPALPHAIRRLALLYALATAALPAAAAPARYVTLPAGDFVSVLNSAPAAGAPSPPVHVAAFALRVLPVTEAEFAAFIAAHPQWQKARVPALYADASYLRRLPATPGDQAVTNVSWFAAQAFCENEHARLPRWHEWEYAAAADRTRRDARADPRWRAAILDWYAQPSARTRTVVGGPPNAYGVRDLHGLVWEWVEDFNALMISADSRNQGDPDLLQYCGAGAISLQDRDNYAILMRVALLSSLGGADTTDNLGFRCARSAHLESP